MPWNTRTCTIKTYNSRISAGFSCSWPIFTMWTPWKPPQRPLNQNQKTSSIVTGTVGVASPIMPNTGLTFLMSADWAERIFFLWLARLTAASRSLHHYCEPLRWMRAAMQVSAHSCAKSHSVLHIESCQGCTICWVVKSCCC